jgi:hypothetical protein
MSTQKSNTIKAFVNIFNPDPEVYYDEEENIDQ